MVEGRCSSVRLHVTLFSLKAEHSKEERSGRGWFRWGCAVQRSTAQSCERARAGERVMGEG